MVNVRWDTPFNPRHTERFFTPSPYEGVGTTPPRHFAANEARASPKNERVACNETQRLVPINKVKGQPVTSEVRSMTSRHGLSLSPITSHKMVVRQKFKRHRVCLEKTSPHRAEVRE